MAKPVTGSLKTTVKLIGDVEVGSAWPAAWSMVTVGDTAGAFQVTELSVLVDAALPVTFTVPVATPAPIFAITVPLVVIPVTATL